jgi:hypothetical protein
MRIIISYGVEFQVFAVEQVKLIIVLDLLKMAVVLSNQRFC